MEHNSVCRHVVFWKTDQKINITRQTILNHVQKLDTQKSWCLCAAWFEADTPIGPSQCLRYAAETKGTRPVFETDGYFRRATDHIRQYQAIAVVDKGRWIVPNSGQAGTIGQNGSVVCSVGLEGRHLLWPAFVWPDAYFCHLLKRTEALKARNGAEASRISEQEGRSVPPRQNRTRHLVDDYSEATQARMGGYLTMIHCSYVLKKHCRILVPKTNTGKYTLQKLLSSPWKEPKFSRKRFSA